MQNKLPSWLKGFLWGISIYLVALISTFLLELSCRGESTCGLISFSVAIFGLPIIPLGAFIGWIKGRKKDTQNHAHKLMWLKGGILGLTSWLVVFAISEHFYFYGNNPNLYNVIFFGSEFGVFYYIAIGVIFSWLYGKTK
jgi:hypothetical protein